MSRRRTAVNAPCCVKGCTNSRYVAGTGVVRPRCLEHYRDYFAAKNQKRNTSLKADRAAKKCVRGRPQPPTVVIDEQAGTVRQIVGNLVLSEMKLPERGLNPNTLLILQARGWRVRYETA